MFALTKLQKVVGGERIVVEIDESRFYERKYIGRKLQRAEWFLVGIQRDDPTKIFMLHVPNRKEDWLLPII